MTEEQKNPSVSQYNRCTAVTFAIYLHEHHYLENNQIEKRRARELFQKEFLSSFRTNYKYNCNFHILFRSLRQAVLEKKVEDPRILKFRPHQLNKFLNGKTEIDQILRNHTGKPRKRTVISQSYAFRKPKTEEVLITTKFCKICGTKFDTLLQYQEHVEDGKHNFLKTVREKRRSKSTGNDLEFSIVGKKSLNNIILRKNQPETVTLLVENVSKKTIKLLSFQIDPLIAHVSFNMQYPVEIKPTSFAQCYITHTCEASTILYYPIVFTAEIANEAQKKQYSVELVFHVQDEFYDFLQPTVPYQRPSKAVVSEVIEEIDSGEPPEATTRQKLKIPLRPYHIPQDVAYLLNTGLKEFENMNEYQLAQLRRIRGLLDVDVKRNCLTASNYTKLLELLLFFEEHQMKKDIRDYDQANQTLNKLNGTMFELHVPGLAEHRPSLILGDVVFVKEAQNSGKVYEGYVHKVLQSSVYLKFSQKFTKEVFVKNKKFYISFSFNRHPIKTEHQAVDLVQSRQLSGLFFPVKLHTRAPHPAPTWFNRDIANNPEQQQAVKYILAKSAYPSPYLIFGPPGTGKTMTVVESVKQIHKFDAGNILICTPSNNAANEVTRRLKELPTTDLLRYVAPSYPYSAIPEPIMKFVNYQHGEFYHPDLAAILKYRIVVTTLVTAAKLYNGGCPGNHFAYVMIDESGQATETETLIPITAVLSAENMAGKLTGQIVLAGDPKQLGPIIHSPIAKEYGFDISMLERLMATDVYGRKNDKYDPCYVTKLLKNYRSHEVLIKESNALFYDNELQIAGDNLINLAVGWEELPNRKFPMIFYSVKGMDQREAKSPSFFNVQEIEIVCRYLDKLIGTTMNGIKIKASHIGVISPYKKQVDKIKMACRKKGYDDGLTVGTIENFQGEERLIIMISTVRSRVDFLTFDYKHHLGFLKNPKRMNVALTRSKALTIVIGNPDILQYDPNWHSFIEYCQQNQAVLGEPFEMQPLESEIESAETAVATAQMSALTVHDTEDGPNFSRGNQ